MVLGKLQSWELKSPGEQKTFFCCLSLWFGNLQQQPHESSARQLNVEGLTRCEITQKSLLKLRHPYSNTFYSSMQASCVWAGPLPVRGRCQDSLGLLSYRIHKMIKIEECDSFLENLQKFFTEHCVVLKEFIPRILCGSFHDW